MFRDEFKERYTTIPFAICETKSGVGGKEIITHQHREVEIISLFEGEADFFVNSTRYSMKAGDVLIIPPYALHRGNTANDKKTSYYCICLDLSLLPDDELRRDLENQIISDVPLVECATEYAKCASEYVRAAFFACADGKRGWELSAVGNISLLFGLLKNKGFFSGKNSSDRDDFGRRAMTYIINNYSAGITSRDAAEALYMNYSYFCRLFKKHFGSCFTDYVLAYRLEKAKVYLKSGSLSVIEIALLVGFNNCSYFCKAFKKYTHTTPLAYRTGKAAAK